MKVLSIIIPVYNERATIEKILDRVEGVLLPNIKKEIIIVDDASTDGTRDILKRYEKKYRVIYQKENMGKGAAVRSGLKEATGDIALIQDADLEYDPNEYGKLIAPIRDGRADVVFGSRFIGDNPHRAIYFWHWVANKLLTTLSNILTNLNLTDMETCYKAFSQEAIQKILPRLTSNRFGIEPELTAMVAKAKLRVYEVGISYSGRSYEEGKKINWKDGVAAFWHILYYNLFR